MQGEIEYDDIVGMWIVELPSGATLGSNDKGVLETVLDAIEEVQQVRRENRGIVLGCILAAFVLGLSAVAAAFISG